MQTNDGVSYSGSWENDVRCGTGKMVWPDGSEYIGQWVDDMRHGKGTMTDKSGR